MKGLIPIGGRGTRMRPVTYSINKHFVPVANRLLIEYPIEALVNAGINEIGIIYNPGQLESAREILGDGSRWGVRFEYIVQPEPAGLANLVEVAREFVEGGKFVLHLGDNIFTAGIKEAVEYFEKSQNKGMVVMVHHKENKRMGVPYFNDQGILERYVEKPEKPPHDLAIPGLYFFGEGVFDAFEGEDRLKKSARGEYEMPDLYQWLIDRGRVIEVQEYKGVWLDPGKFDDWLASNQYLLDQETEVKIAGELDADSRVEGRVEIGEGSVVINSLIRGPVKIGKKVTVKNSFVGPFTSIYDQSEITDCRVENTIVMGGVKMENVAKTVDASIIGADCVVVKSRQKGSVGVFLGQGSILEI